MRWNVHWQLEQAASRRIIASCFPPGHEARVIFVARARATLYQARRLRVAQAVQARRAAA